MKSNGSVHETGSPALSVSCTHHFLPLHFLPLSLLFLQSNSRFIFLNHAGCAENEINNKNNQHYYINIQCVLLKKLNKSRPEFKMICFELVTLIGTPVHWCNYPISQSYSYSSADTRHELQVERHCVSISQFSTEEQKPTRKQPDNERRSEEKDKSWRKTSQNRDLSSVMLLVKRDKEKLITSVPQAGGMGNRQFLRFFS